MTEHRVPLAELAPGAVVARKGGRDAKRVPVEALVLLAEDGTPRVYRNLCRHLPVPIDGGSRSYFDESGTLLQCALHGALYRVGDGMCIEGPCEGDALEALPFVVEDGQVVFRLP